MSASNPADLLKHYEFDPTIIDRVNFRTQKQPLIIMEPDPTWPSQFHAIEARITTALGPKALKISHVGSTSIPGMPAKPVIDIDLTVADPADEPSYVPALEAAGFLFLTREPSWQGHRLFTITEPHCNLHVFNQGAAEPARHLLFRDWLLENEEDRVLYAGVKREMAATSQQAGENIINYNLRKEPVIREILGRMFLAKGLLN